MATLQNIGKLKYRGKDGQWHPLPVVVQDASGGVSTISGKGAPTSETQGEVNQLYRDELTDKLYICTGVEGGYTWAAVVSDTEDAVTYTAQTLTEEQKTQARANIGAGTSNFSGSYNDLTNKPNIPAASVIDTTLTKSGQAADAKAAGDAIGKKLDKAQGVENAGMILGVDESGNVVPENKPVQALAGVSAPTTATAGVVGQEYYVIVNNAVTEMYVCTSALIGSYTWDKVEFGGGTSNAVQYTEQSLSDTQKQQARTNIGAGTSNFSGSYNDLTNTPVLDTTLEQSGKPADAKAVGDAIGSAIDAVTTILGDSKVDKSQGTENAGKILGIGASGIVTPVDKPVYTLPIATPTALGGVMPVSKTTAMTQGVGVSEDGKLYTAPSGGGTDKSLGITSATVGQIAKITAVDAAGKPTAWEPVNMPSGGGVGGHWETVLDTVWEQDVINPTAFNSETGIFTCAEGELANLALDTKYVFYQQCAVKDVAYNTILNNENAEVTKLSDTTFSINVTPPTTFVPTNVKFSKGACLAITDIDAKKIRLTLDGQFKPTATLYDKPFYGINVPFFGQNTGYMQIRNAYQAYQQVTAEVESPFRIVGEILCGFNVPSQNPSFHFKNNSFCCPLIPYDVPEGYERTYFLTSDGTKIAKLYSAKTPWHFGGPHEDLAITNDFLKIISGTKVKLERWVE